jgi:predicted DNA-binding transcriptional regulator AlpA
MKAKKIFEFTLILKNVDENTSGLEDSLYDAGCNDALIHFRNGAVYLNFDREAVSLEEAVISAIKDVQSARVNAEVASVAPENLVTESEIAKRLNKSRQTVSLWIKGNRRKSFPHPIMRLAEKSSLWSWSEVVLWLYDYKIIDDKEWVDKAAFFSNINGALEERDKKTREIRHGLLERIAEN